MVIVTSGACAYDNAGYCLEFIGIRLFQADPKVIVYEYAVFVDLTKVGGTDRDEKRSKR